MPKKFNEREKEHIRIRLLETGKEHFSTYGLKKTSVEELTSKVGIAQGSFYLFFGSKEELFFEIMEQEEALIREQLLEELQRFPTIDEARLRHFLTEAFHSMGEHPIFRQVMDSGQLEAILRKLPLERLEGNRQEDTDVLKPVVERWQQQGILNSEQPEIVVSMIRSLMLLSTHRKEIGDAVYDQTISLLIRVIAAGMLNSH